MTNSKMEEVILVASRKKVFNEEGLTFQGVINSNNNQDTIAKIVSNINSNIETMRRGDAEENKEYKQPIPYAVIKRGDELYGYTRLEGGGESRLHGKISLGVGGHCNHIDGIDDFYTLLLENLNRELEEEVSITQSSGEVVGLNLSIIGLINDDHDAVGEVHIGILAFIELPLDAEVTVKETEQLEGKWFTKDELLENYERLENWSAFVVDTL